MTEKEKFDYLIEKGYYATEDGKVISHLGKSVGSIKKFKDNRRVNSKLQTRIVCTFKIKKKLYYFKSHRFIFYFFYNELPEMIDHIDGNPLNNELTNLRSSNQLYNMWNLNFAKGYTFDKIRNKWKSQISVDNKLINLGRFDTEEEARQAYLDAKKIYHVIPQ